MCEILSQITACQKLQKTWSLLPIQIILQTAAILIGQFVQMLLIWPLTGAMVSVSFTKYESEMNSTLNQEIIFSISITQAGTPGKHVFSK